MAVGRRRSWRWKIRRKSRKIFHCRFFMRRNRQWKCVRCAKENGKASHIFLLLCVFIMKNNHGKWQAGTRRSLRIIWVLRFSLSFRSFLLRTAWKITLDDGRAQKKMTREYGENLRNLKFESRLEWGERRGLTTHHTDDDKDWLRTRSAENEIEINRRHKRSMREMRRFSRPKCDIFLKQSCWKTLNSCRFMLMILCLFIWTGNC